MERKTVRGLHAAIINGTFWPQVGRLREGTLFAYLLLEGKDIDDGPLGAAAIRGTCIALIDLGVGLIRATDARDSALRLQRLAVRRASALYRNRPAYAQRPKREAGAPAAEAALGAVPGISRASAAALLRHFGTLAAIVRAGPDDWMRVPGIGPARARGLAETFHTPQTASRARLSRDRQDPST